MKLTDYLYGTYAGACSNGFPRELELPQDFAGGLERLYHYGETNACEYGCRVAMSPNATPIPQHVATVASSLGVHLQQVDLVHGTANGCQIPRTNFPGECADMHSHPSTSIGHVDGYSAHSLQDYLVFQHHLSRPVFIRFVVSGPWFYAVVYRHGLTQYNQGDITQRISADENAMWTYFGRMNNTSRDQVQQLLADAQLQHGIDTQHQMVEWKRQTKGFGKWIMEASIEHNTDLAKRERYGFYAAKNSSTLHLQAGPPV